MKLDGVECEEMRYTEPFYISESLGHGDSATMFLEGPTWNVRTIPFASVDVSTFDR